MQITVSRSAYNPLLTPASVSALYPNMEVICLLNPGVFEYEGRVGLLVRVAERPVARPGFVPAVWYTETGLQTTWFSLDDPLLDASDPRVIRYKGIDYLTTISYLLVLWSKDGVHFHTREDHPPLTGAWPNSSYGLEDARVTQIDDRYLITCTAVSAQGVAVAQFETSDWKLFTGGELIFPPHNKDVAIFDQQVGGKYLAFHRPSSPSLGGNFIWLAESPDTRHWGNHRCVLTTRAGYWDSARVGAGASPILTTAGWLAIYHGADEAHRYCLGVALFDAKDPTQLLARSERPFFEPTEPYEQAGFFGGVVFTNGHLVDHAQQAVVMYYGAADTVIGSARVSIADLMFHLGLPTDAATISRTFKPR